MKEKQAGLENKLNTEYEKRIRINYEGKDYGLNNWRDEMAIH